MEVSAAIKSRIATDIAGYVAKANKHFGRTYMIPIIQYNLKGTTAGIAKGSGVVNFNPIILNENVEDFIARTVPHEVAHCIDTANGDTQRRGSGIVFTRTGRMRRAKRSVHGPSWERIMTLFGVEDITRCHNYDVTNARTKTKAKFEYACDAGHQYFVSSVIHNKIVLRGQERWCRQCGRTNGQLRYVQPLGQRTYEEAKKVSEARAANAAAPTKEVLILIPVPAPKGNMAIAKGIMTKYGNQLTRGQFIVRAVEAGIKATTASTYFNMLRSK